MKSQLKWIDQKLTVSFLVAPFMITSILMVGCASYLTRKDCEKINWFNYAKGVALLGKPLESDPQLQSCRKVEAEMSDSQIDLGFKSGRKVYCQPDYARGESAQGRFYNFEFCQFDNKTLNEAKKHFSEGLKSFCTEDQGLKKGAAGWEYNQICDANKDQLKDFMRGLHRGRVQFLRSEVNRISSQIAHKSSEMRTERYEIGNLQGRIAQARGEIARLQSMRDRMSRDPLQSAAVAQLDSSIQEAESIKFGLETTERQAWARIDQLQSDIEALEKERSLKASEERTLQVHTQ